MNKLVKMVRRFVFRKMNLIPLFLIISYFIITTAWRQWNVVPVPQYIPQDGHWKLIAKESGRSWNLPCVYTRFEVDQPQSTIATQIKKVIHDLRKWDRSGEQTFKSILDEIREDPHLDIEDKAFLYGMQESKFASLKGVIGKDYFIHTERPFVVFSWFGHEKGEIHHYISVRLIGTGDKQTTVEIWDMRTPDL